MRTIFEFTTPSNKKLPKNPFDCFSSRFFHKHTKSVPKTSYKLSNLLFNNSSPYELKQFDSINKIYIEIDDIDLALYMSFNHFEYLNPSRKKFVLTKQISLDDDAENKLEFIKTNLESISKSLIESKKIILEETKLFSSASGKIFFRRNFLDETVYDNEYTKNFVDFDNLNWDVNISDSQYHAEKMKSLKVMYDILVNKLTPIMLDRRNSYTKIEELHSQYLKIIGK